MSAAKRKRSGDSSSSEDNESRFAEAVDPVLHGKLYGTVANANGILLLRLCLVVSQLSSTIYYITRISLSNVF